MGCTCGKKKIERTTYTFEVLDDVCVIESQIYHLRDKYRDNESCLDKLYIIKNKLNMIRLELFVTQNIQQNNTCENKLKKLKDELELIKNI